MALLALLIAIIALILAWMAYQRSGGATELHAKAEDLGINPKKMRCKFADMLGKMEKSVRGDSEARCAEPTGEPVDGEIIDEAPAAPSDAAASPDPGQEPRG